MNYRKMAIEFSKQYNQKIGVHCSNTLLDFCDYLQKVEKEQQEEKQERIEESDELE